MITTVPSIHFLRYVVTKILSFLSCIAFNRAYCSHLHTNSRGVQSCQSIIWISESVRMTMIVLDTYVFSLPVKRTKFAFWGQKSLVLQAVTCWVKMNFSLWSMWWAVHSPLQPWNLKIYGHNYVVQQQLRKVPYVRAWGCKEYRRTSATCSWAEIRRKVCSTLIFCVRVGGCGDWATHECTLGFKFFAQLLRNTCYTI